MSFLQASTSTGSGSELEPLIRHAKAKTRRSCGRGTRGAVVWIHGAGEVALVHLRPPEPELDAVFDSGDGRKVLRNSVTVNGNWWKRGLEDLSVQVQSCYHNVAPASLLPRSLVLARRYVWQLKSLVSKCLAVVTLVGTEDDWETQASSMEIVCHFIESYSSHSKNSENDSVPVLAAALPSWSLLLTTVDVQRLNNKHWKGVMSYIVELLEVEEKSIFEKGRVETFSSEACTYLFPQEWKDKIIDQVRQECNSKWEILKLFEDEYELQMRMDICCHSLMLSTLLQLKQEIFNFKPAEDPSGPEL